MSSPLHPITNCQSYISGEVIIAPSAAIAVGVILQAEPNSRIIISAGVCIGMGAILHAHDGNLEVEAGATLGAGVLVVGNGKIGSNACIGPNTTIVNCSIEPHQVIAPSSLIGDTSRQINERATDKSVSASDSEEVVSTAISPGSPSPELATNQPEANAEANGNNSPKQVYGKSSLNNLLSTLFPYNQLLNKPLQDDSSKSQ